MEERIREIQRLMRLHTTDALWLCGGANRRYATSFTGSAGWVLIPARGRAVLITDGRYAEQAAQEAHGVRIVVVQGDSVAVAAAQLQRWNCRRLGVEEEDVSLAAWNRLKRRTGAMRPVPARAWLADLRQVKTPVELRLLRRAVRIADTAYQRLLPWLRPGRSEVEVARTLEGLMAEAGAEGMAFPTIVASGPRSSLPHAQPGSRRLRSGDLVVLDFGCIYQGYHSDLTRTVAIARMTAKQQEIYKSVKNAQKSAQKKMFSGHLAADCDRIARQALRQDGLEQWFVHSLGHGLGLEIHEDPRLSPLSKDRLKSGMVVTCEPGVYLPGWGGIRIEDDVVVGATAGQWLSRSSDTLTVVGRPGRR